MNIILLLEAEAVMFNLDGFLPAAKPAGQWIIFGFFFLPSRFVKQSTMEAREALEHRSLGPVSSNMKSEVT